VVADGMTAALDDVIVLLVLEIPGTQILAF
jgi:hypothetical protein